MATDSEITTLFRKKGMLLEKILGKDKKQEIAFNSAEYKEHPLRSMTKAISWRIIGTFDTVLISWLITGEVSMALTIGSTEVITKVILYYGHERVWNLIKWRK